MFKIIQPIIIAALISLNTCAWAQNIDYGRLAFEYVSALKDRDQKAIVVIWKTINADPEAQAFLELNYPWAYSAYRLIGISLRLSQSLADYRNKYGEIAGGPGEAVNLDAILAQIMEDGSSKTNRNMVLDHPNMMMPLVQDSVVNNPNQNQPNNRVLSMSSPNQDQLSNQGQVSNQDSIKRQLRLMEPVKQP